MPRIWITLLLAFTLTALVCGQAKVDEDDDEDVVVTEAEITPEDRAAYKSPETSEPAHLAENFDDEERFRRVWIKSEAKKEGIDEDIAQYDGEIKFQCLITFIYLFIVFCF